MQEGNSEKWLAASLRKQQEENPLPYEPGAWEAFEQKRKSAERKTYVVWISGIAASLILLMVAGGVWLSQETKLVEDTFSEPIALEQSQVPKDLEGEKLLGAELKETEVPQERTGFLAESQSTNLPSKAKSNQFLGQKQAESVIPSLATTQNQNAVESVTLESKTESLIAQEQQQIAQNPLKLQAEIPVEATQELPKEPLMSEEEIKEVLSGEKSSVNLAMGLSPGFGTSQGAEQTTSGSSLGLGVLVDMDLPGKLTLGSGLAVNYLNQASQSQSYAQVAGFSSPVTQTNEISQVQLDVPLYVRYPITRSRSVSVQAGFSNLLTFNQNAEQQSSYTRQVAVLDASAASANAFTLKSESVSQVSALDVPENRFYPFATANLGVNVRLYESKKTSYELMPFYNYPLQEFSGYGEKLGMFGASFKVNFGAIQKK